MGSLSKDHVNKSNNKIAELRTTPNNLTKGKSKLINRQNQSTIGKL